MNDLIKRFTTFDKLIATSLIKLLYWIGLAGIALGVIVGLFGAFATMTQSFVAGLGMLVAVPVGGVIGLIFLRFICGIYILSLLHI